MAKRPTGAWGWMVLPATPKLEDSLDGATRRLLYTNEYIQILQGIGMSVGIPKFLV